jgi:lipoic acid synthetase
VTSVTRDDLPDGGARHFAATIEAVREALPGAAVEVLIPDFRGDERALDAVLEAAPDVIGHNLETVRRLYPLVRRGANYDQSLGVLERSARSPLVAHTKTAFMLGLGETHDEVRAAALEARSAGADTLYMGQYLSPTAEHFPVDRFVTPTEFEELRDFAVSAGFDRVSSGPFVRSSYHADAAASGSGVCHGTSGPSVSERSEHEDQGHSEALRAGTRANGVR